MKGKVSISPVIAALSAEDKKKWIADRKKANKEVDWEGELKKVKNEPGNAGEESPKN